MIDFYIKFKLAMEFLIPIFLISIIFIIAFISLSFKYIRETRIEKFFKKNGYKRELFDVPSFGDGAFYGWVRESDNKRVDDRDIKGWSLKQIKEKYK